MIDGCGTFKEFNLRLMDLTGDESDLVWVMACCRQFTGYYPR